MVRPLGSDTAALAQTQSTNTAQQAKPERTGLTRHLDTFFDRNGDRKIVLSETYRGVRDLGVGRAGAAAVALAINVGLGRATDGGFFTVNLDKIPQGMHGGDSGVLDVNGRFQPAAFEAIFDTHAKKYGDALTADEVSAFRKANHDNDPDATAGDFVAGLGEFGLLFRLGAQERGGEKVLTRDRLLEFYTGDLFDTIATEHKEMRAERGNTLVGKIQNAWNTWVF